MNEKKKVSVFNIPFLSFSFSFFLMGRRAESIVVWNPDGNTLISDQKFSGVPFRLKRKTIKFGQITGKIYWYASSKRTNKRNPSKNGTINENHKIRYLIKKEKERTRRNEIHLYHKIYCETLWQDMFRPPWSISCYCIYNIRNLINSRLSCGHCRMYILYLFSFSLSFHFSKQKKNSQMFFLSYISKKSIPCNWKHVHISECFMFNLLHGRFSV